MTRARTAGLAPLQAETLALLLKQQPGWCRPVDIGGGAGTQHSARLRHLVSKGLAESRPYTALHSKGRQTYAREYRITPGGKSAYEVYEEAIAKFQR